MGSIDKEDDSEKFSLASRLKSFVNAFSGLSLILKHEHNFRIHIIILVFVIVSGICFNISATDWIAVAIVSGLVLTAECFNSAIEYLSNVVSPEIDPVIRNVKDAAAAGVLIAAIAAVIVGLIIFVPEILQAINDSAGK
jgi:diacylglycerol kinase